MSSLLGQQVLSGEVVSPEALPICEVLVELLDESQNVIAQDMTEEDGTFSFEEVASGDYHLRFSRQDQPLNGTSTYDLVLSMRHVLGFDNLSPYQIWATDVNGTGTTTTLDLLLMRRVILGIEEGFSETNWMFDEEDLPLTESPDNQVAITLVDTPINVAIIGVKLGDVNGNAVLDCQ